MVRSVGVLAILGTQGSSVRMAGIWGKGTAFWKGSLTGVGGGVSKQVSVQWMLLQALSEPCGARTCKAWEKHDTDPCDPR